VCGARLPDCVSNVMHVITVNAWLNYFDFQLLV